MPDRGGRHGGAEGALLPGAREEGVNARAWKNGLWSYDWREGEQVLCYVLPRGKCSDCPFVTCNNHPQFYLALQCAQCLREAHRAARPR